jgi:hypothetical protein
MQPVVILPIPIYVPVPEGANGWLSGPKRPWPAKPRPTSWPLNQSIPASPAVRELLDQARRMMAERRAEQRRA